MGNSECEAGWDGGSDGLHSDLAQLAWLWADRPMTGGGVRGGEGGGREGAVAFPHPTHVGGGLASAGSPDVSSGSSRSWRQRFNRQDFGLRTDVASLGLEAGRAGAEEGAGRSGQNRLRETPARRP